MFHTILYHQVLNDVAAGWATSPGPVASSRQVPSLMAGILEKCTAAGHQSWNLQERRRV